MKSVIILLLCIILVQGKFQSSSPSLNYFTQWQSTITMVYPNSSVQEFFVNFDYDHNQYRSDDLSDNIVCLVIFYFILCYSFIYFLLIFKIDYYYPW